MIVDVPYVKISGIKYPVYSVDYSINGESISTLVVDFVCEDELLREPLLNTQSLTTINISDKIVFTGYAVASEISESVSSGRSMQVRYVDTSILLDKLFVGLHGVHGDSKVRTIRTERTGSYTVPTPDTSGTFFNIVLVGNYVDPCEGLSYDYIDPCDACPSHEELTSILQNNTSKEINCINEIQTRILDVRYNFQELISKLSSKGIKFVNTPAVNVNYYGRFTGTAREVLKSWCNELGLTFYWNNGSVNFVDLKFGININDTNLYEDCQLISKKTSKSIENNSYRGNIYYYGGEGRIIENDCSSKNAYRLSMLPITLKDIFWSYINDGSIGGKSVGLSPYISKYYTFKDSPNPDYRDKNSIEGLQLACVLSYHSEHLRDLFLLHHFYGITNFDSLVGTNKSLLLLGIEKVVEVHDYSEVSDDYTGEDPADRIFHNELTAKDREFCREEKGKMLKIIYNKAYHDRFKALEKALAREFMGRYWISYLSDRNYQISGPDGSPVFYTTKGVPNFPFLEFIPESIRASSVFLNKILKQTRENNSPEGDIVSEIKRNFILLDRKAAWEPTSLTEDFIKADKYLEKISPFYLGPFKSTAGDDTEKKLAHEEVFIIAYDTIAKDNLQIDISEIYHPTETENKNIPTDSSFAGITSYYGLRASGTKKYHINFWLDGLVDIDIIMPVQAHDDFGNGFSGYTVIATPKPMQVITKSLLQKKEVIVGDCPQLFGNNSYGVDNTVSSNIVFKDLSSPISSVIEGAGGTCGYSVPLIKNLINDYKYKSSFPKQIEAVSVIYDIKGLPARTVSLSDGLNSLSIRLDSDGGIATSLSFSNMPKVTISESIISKEVERNQLRRLAKFNPVSSSNKINI